MSAIGAVVARFVHTEEVTGSNPVSRTNVQESSDVRSEDFCIVTREPEAAVFWLNLWT